MKDKIINALADIIVLLPILVILMLGCHCEATYVVKGTVNSIEENIVSFEVRDNIFKCTATETESLNKGDEFWVKLTNEATESYLKDDHLIDFGTHHFLCFVW